MRIWSGTARRLLLSFGLVTLVFAAASYSTLAALREIHEGLHRTRENAESVRIALELASAVRDQYAHQAHTIIIGDESHLGFYDAAHKRVLELLPQVRQHANGPDELAWVNDIAEASAALDRVFRERIVSAVLRGETSDVRLEHDRAQQLVNLIQERTERLVERREGVIRDFQTHAYVIQHKAVAWTVVFHLAAVGVSIGAGLYVGRSVARPMARLRQAAEGLARGDLETRFDVDTSPDEFGALARQFDAMTRALRDHQARLVQSEKLAGIGRLAAGVAHEINNPLGVILGYAGLLRKRADPAVAEDLRVIEDEALRCREIVEGLLDLSRPLPAPSAPTYLRDLADDVLARLGEAKLLDGVAVTIEGTAVVPGHAPKLRQVLFNLVKNAAEAAGAGGRVDVRVGDSCDTAQVAVSDSGPGVSPEARARLFEPFFTTKDHGTGLGLAVSQAIARAHHGAIEVDASALGGARFTLILPRLPAGGTQP